MTRPTYDEEFFAGMEAAARPSAETIIPLLEATSIDKIRSVLDVGCAIGVWLSIFAGNGAQILGVDGDYVDRSSLLIPIDRFLAHDLATPLKLDQTFDLVMSLEVAEHLDPSVAEMFVESLGRHGDVVLFSAAIPGQGGVHHVNEQWPSYWVELFERNGFQLFDALRPALWNNTSVETIFKQNLLLFARGERAIDLASTQIDHMPGPDVVHPDYYLLKAAQPSLTQILRSRIALRTRSRQLMHRLRRLGFVPTGRP